MPNTFLRVGNGPHPVIVLHGWFGDAHSFKPIEPWLSGQRFSYIFMDCRGYGGMREARGAYTMDEIAADALALADALGYPAFSLIGHSMGGMASERIATLARSSCCPCLPWRRCLAAAWFTMPRRGVCSKTPRNMWTAAKPSSIAAPAAGCRRPGSNGRRPIRRRAPPGKHSPPIYARGPTPISASRSAAGIR
ncbi:alpha/beta fold hydrolase [Chromobacterium sp. Beijing]|uniref:alpha/beta fold hydrolase n=1 Tax=Chromobacterium sp. Beijing TaxID=2735795 RepID=UPI00351CCABE